MENEKIKCGNCGAENVRLYRPYGNFYRPKDNRCNDCLEITDWMVPCVQAEDMTIWGYSSVNEEDLAKFNALAEKNPLKATWVSDKSTWSNNLQKVRRKTP